MIVKAFVFAIALNGLPGTSFLSAQDRPNILWVTSEDNSFHWLGCYGNDQAATPNLDRLAAQGIRYRYAYANAPVCAVARCSIITGRYACSLGTQNMRSRYPIPSKFKTFVSYLRESGYYCVNRSKTDYNFDTKDKNHWDDCSGKAHWKNGPAEKPFFAVFNSTISHESSLFAEKTARYRKRNLIPATPRLKQSQVHLPPFLPDTREIREDWITYVDVVEAMDKQIGEWLDELDRAEQRDNTIVIYYSDHGGVLPRAKRYLYDTGTHVPMIVRIPKKWSHLAPEKSGSASSRLVSFIDLPPTALSLAGISVPNTMQGQAFLGKSVGPAKPYVFLFGQRFDARMLRFVRGVTNGRFRYIRNFYPHRHRGILAGYAHGQQGWESFYRRQKTGETNKIQAAIWRQPQPVEELYDTTNDPWEVANLAGDPQYASQLKAMRKATLEQMKSIRDTGLVPEAMYAHLSAQGTVHDYVNQQDFPYDDVLELALLASDPNRATRKRFQQAIKSDHAVKQFWGATGCTILGENAAPMANDLLQLLEHDFPIVRIAGSEALLASGQNDEAAVECLEDILSTTNDRIIALEALNVIDGRGLKSRISKESFDRGCRIGKFYAHNRK